MELAGFLIQMAGAIITGVGLFIAWDRAASRDRTWRSKIDDFRTGLPARLAKLRGDNIITPEPGRLTLTGHTPLVINAPVDPEKRSNYILETLARLDIRISAIDAAIEKEVADLGEADKLVELRDLRLAIVGLGISLLGFVVEHVPMLMSSICQCG